MYFDILKTRRRVLTKEDRMEEGQEVGQVLDEE